MANPTHNPSPRAQSSAKTLVSANAKASGNKEIAPNPESEGTFSTMLDVGLAVGVAGAASFGAAAGLADQINGLIEVLNAESNTSFSRCQQEKALNSEAIDPKDKEWGWNCAKCDKTGLGKYINPDKKEGDAPKESPSAWEVLFSALSELSQPADLAGCINPYWQKFFNLVPYQMLLSYYLKSILRDLLESRTTINEEVQEMLKETACGTELIKLTKRSEQIENFEFPGLDMLTLPPIPTFRIPNLSQILNKIIVDALCYAICCTITPLISNLAAAILKFTDQYAEDAAGGSIDVESSFAGPGIKKINLNDWIPDGAILAAIEAAKLSISETTEIIPKEKCEPECKEGEVCVGAKCVKTEKAVTTSVVIGYNKLMAEILGPKPSHIFDYEYQQGLWRTPTEMEEESAQKEILRLVKGPGGYFDKIYDFSTTFKKKVFIPKSKPPVYKMEDTPRDLGTKELLYLVMGETNCEILEDILKVSTSDAAFVNYLNLNDIDKILNFFKFLGNYVDVFAVIEASKPVDCPDPCLEVDESTKEEVTSVLNNLCSALNPAIGVPPIPTNMILSKLGLLDLIGDGIKAQFAFLKSKYYDFLGNPPYCGCDGFTPSGPVHPPAKAPNQYYFEMQNSIFYKLKGKIASAGSSIVSDADFDKYYRKFIVEVLSRGGAGGSSTKECPATSPFTPFWPYDNIDFNVDGTLADDCVDESFLEVYNAVFKEGFDLAPEDLKDVSTYIEEIKEQLTATETKLLMERANRAGPGKEEADGPCCKFKDFTHTRKTPPGSWDIVGPSPGDASNDAEAALVIKLHTLHNSTIGPDDEGLIYATVGSMTLEEKCYVCRRTAFVDGVSILAYYETYNDLNEGEVDIVKAYLNCNQFDTDVSKCPKE